MSFLREETRARFWRWREVALFGLVAANGLWWALTAFGLMVWIGWALVVLGAVFGFGAVQRLRFGGGGGGAGVVQVDERRVSYFGPLTGGIVDLDDLATLALDGDAKPAHWRLLARDGTALAIPVNAEGADALFDAFTALPGLRTERLLSALKSPGRHVATLWARDAGDLTRLPGG